MYETQFLFGVVPSPNDSRDYQFKDVKVSLATNILPVEYKTDTSIIPILNQGSIESCVAHVTGIERTYTEYKQSDDYQLFSVGFDYGLREPEHHQGEGMIPREALKMRQKYGSVPYYEFPYNLPYPQVKEKIERNRARLLKIAEPHRISTYYRIGSDDIESIKTAIKSFGFALISIPIHQSFYNKKWHNIIPIPDYNNDKLLGRHMMIIEGWDRYGNWIVRNSWGEKFGNKGYCYIPFMFPIEEVWVVTDGILPNGTKLIPVYDVTTQYVYDNEVEAEKAITTIIAFLLKDLPQQFKDRISIVYTGENYRIVFGTFEDSESAKNYKKQIEEFSIYANHLLKVTPRYINNSNNYKIILKNNYGGLNVTKMCIDAIEKYYFTEKYYSYEELNRLQKLIAIEFNNEYRILIGKFNSLDEANEYIKLLEKSMKDIGQNIEIIKDKME